MFVPLKTPKFLVYRYQTMLFSVHPGGSLEASLLALGANLVGEDY